MGRYFRTKGDRSPRTGNDRDAIDLQSERLRRCDRIGAEFPLTSEPYQYKFTATWISRDVRWNSGG
jgi:hypothetical protein